MASRVVKIQNRADPMLFLATTTGVDVVLDLDSNDENQYWIQDSRFASEARDATGQPGYLFINKATGKALKAAGSKMMNMLVDVPQDRDDHALWSMGKDEGSGFHAFRPIGAIELNLDAFGGTEAVKDGTVVGTHEWKESSNQMWKILLPEEVEQWRQNHDQYESKYKEAAREKKASMVAGGVAAALGTWAVYEWHKSGQDAQTGGRHKLQAEILGGLAAAVGGVAIYENYDSKNDSKAAQGFIPQREEDEDKKKGWF